MSEVSEQSHHLKTPGSPSGGSSGDPLLEHPPSCKQKSASPEIDDRGRQRDKQHRQDRDINTDKLWQSKGAQQRGVCRDLAAGNELSKCHPHKKPDGNHHHHHASEHDNGEADNHIDSDTGLDPSRAGGKKRHRRRTSKKKRHWKPYFKLSWEEKKALDERETARASRVREEMFAKGLPVAPYNTTQFLMDEHDREEPDLNTESGGLRRQSGVGVGLEDTGSEEDFLENNNDEEDEEEGSDGIGRPGNAGGEFLQRDFSETYEMYHVESLQNMTKQELVKEYLELEKCMSRLEEENNRLRRAMEPPEEGSLSRLRELECELERLRAQNSELLLQNQPATK